MEKHPGGRPKEKDSIRSNGKTSIAVDIITKQKLKVISGKMPMSRWLRREAAELYFNKIKREEVIENGQSCRNREAIQPA